MKTIVRNNWNDMIPLVCLTKHITENMNSKNNNLHSPTWNFKNNQVSQNSCQHGSFTSPSWKLLAPDCRPGAICQTAKMRYKPVVSCEQLLCSCHMSSVEKTTPSRQSTTNVISH